MRPAYLRIAIFCTTVMMVSAPAMAVVEARQHIQLPAQGFDTSLRAVALAFGRSVSAPTDLVAHGTPPAVDGIYSFEEAVAALLVGSDLEAVPAGGGLAVRRVANIVRDTNLSSDILVTGTRIRGAVPAGARVITVDRETIDRSGYATTQQVLQTLPQNFGGGPNEGTLGFSTRNNSTVNVALGSSVNLRGLGTTSTLTLIDGRRVALGGISGTYVDLSMIPASAIDRIEVLADGASALYGSDAVAGVVNVKMRNAYRGFETRFRYGFADGFDELQASQLAGFGWAGGGFTVGYEFYRRGNLAAADRAYVTEDLRPFGGPDYRGTFANPGTIIAADGNIFGIPRGQDGTGLTAAQLLAGQPNRGDGKANTDVLPFTRRHAVFGSVTQDISDWLRFRAQGFFASRRSTSRIIPDNYGNVVVPVSNPFYVDPIGTGQPVRVNYAFERDLGPETIKASVKSWSVVGGLEAEFGRWSADLSGTYAIQLERERTENIPNYHYLGLALADTDPATAYNLFGDGSFTNPATIERVRGFFAVDGQSRVWSMTGKLEGPLFRLAGNNEARLALGGEYRREHYAAGSTDFGFTAQPLDSGSAGFPLGRSVAAAFAELSLPIVGPDNSVPGIERLDVSLAGRIEHYSDFGTTANPKVGLTWKPGGGVSLRGSYGTSFRAPSFIDIRSGRGTSQFVPMTLADPTAPSGSSVALVLFGARPDTGPEKARTWTVGADFTPNAVPGLRMALTYFDIAYRDRIANVGTEYQSFLSNRAVYGELLDDSPSAAAIAAYYQDQNFINPFGISADRVQVIADARTRNLSTVKLRGLDFDLGYSFARGKTEIATGVSGSYLFGVKQRVTSRAPIVDVVSTFGNPVDVRLRGRLTAARGPWSAAAFVNYTNHYLNDVVAPNERVSSWTTMDVQLAYQFDQLLPGVKLALNISNLFDRAPPYVHNRTLLSASGFDPENASPVGRLVALQLVKSW